jgi:glycosyltransferase involved in cell wall biosynthesis
MLTSDTPQPFGPPVRTFHFAKALAGFGELSLAVFSADSQAQIPADLQGACRRLIRSKPLAKTASNGTAHGRVKSWLQAIAVLALPWRDDWCVLLRYALAFCGDGSRPAGRLSHRALAALLQLELSAAARWGEPLPMVAFLHRAAFYSLRPELAALLARERFDLVWFESGFNYPFLQTLLPELMRPRLVCHIHNIEWHLAQRLERMAPGKRAAAWWRTQSRLLKRLETRAFKNSDIVFACSEQDKRLALELVPAANIAVVSNGVDAAFFQPSPERVRAPAPTLLFTGTFDYGPNTDALKHFVADVFPLIKRRVPNCRFVFAGRNARSAFEGLGVEDTAITYVTDPADMRPQFERAWVFVVPLRVGGGVRCKIFEAMAMECPVVSTPIGAEGVPYVNGEHLLLAETPGPFADAVVRLLSDSTLRERLQTQAAVWARRNYDWSHLCSQAILSLQQLSNVSSRE